LFSSRRRHTRFSRDWSSDVCSSDLNLGVFPRGKTEINRMVFSMRVLHRSSFTAHLNIRDLRVIRCSARLIYHPAHTLDNRLEIRSEERRVGNECRFMVKQ